ncbi:type II 3-dehydroquinate dehydratase [Mycobacterium sp. NPDC050441]|uniref:type II 3-dehydroquinate dehydratase n=1 Tax=Mycobacterium sp. NPDC050441 TaxID=3155403 RepID=UPI00340369A7
MTATKEINRLPDAPAWRIALLNGLNMTNLGRRDKNVYGTIGSLQELESLVSEAGRYLGTHVLAFHSNHEGDLVDFIESDDSFDGYLINPGGLWAFGVPTRIALEQTGKPFVEVHFANIFATGHRSTFTQSAAGTAMGFRHHGYLGALAALVATLDASAEQARS